MRRLGWFLLLLVLGEWASFAQIDAQSDFTKLTLEELLDINVTSVSRRAEPLDRTAAAITVYRKEPAGYAAPGIWPPRART